MNTDFKEIENSALKLDEKHRAELAKRLLESLEDQIDEDVEQAWITELKNRKKQIDAGEVSPIPADDVLKKARKLLKK